MPHLETEIFRKNMDLYKKSSGAFRIVCLFLFNLVITGTIFVGCSQKEDDINIQTTIDVTKPVTTIEIPNKNASIKVGQTLPITLKFTDNVALSEALILFHFDDGHVHKVSPWDTSFKISLSSKQQIVTREIPIPINIASGPYFLEVQCLDKSGNKADLKEAEIEVMADGQPSISEVTIDSKPVDDKFDVSFNGNSEITFNLKEKLQSASLDSVFLLMYEAAESMDKTSHSLFQKRIGIKGKPVFLIDENITLNSSDFKSDESHMILYTRVIEASGHNTVKKIQLFIKK